VDCGVVEKSGAWLSFEGERIGQGRENARKLLLENCYVRSVRRRGSEPRLDAIFHFPAFLGHAGRLGAGPAI
jgi:hypothetical protein